MSNYSDAIAEYLANGGEVKRVETGTTAYNSRDIYNAIRNGEVACSVEDQITRESEAIYTAQRDAFDAAKYDGWSNDAALEYAMHAKP